MNTLVIDCGSYSVKFLEGKFQRKHFKIDKIEEVFVNNYVDPQSDTTLIEYQQEIIFAYLEESQFTGKIITQLPNDYITTRYLDLPVNNKKKADLMIPFQLDENLPFPMGEAHYVSTLYKNTNSNMSSVIQITEDKVFSLHHEFLKDSHTLPSVLISELGSIQSYIEDRKFGTHVCILDIGHNTTKAYFAYNDRLLSNHIFSTAGKTLNEIIANTYDITLEEAQLYKHENAYFLTEGQIDQVNEDQKEFAILMRETFSPLVQQIQRWLLGYRIKTGFSVEKIYITGGSANIKNLENFLSEKLAIPVGPLKIVSLEGQVDPTEVHSYTLPFLFAQSQKFKNPPNSFLTKTYASALTGGIKMEDSIFSLYRVSIIATLFALSFVLEAALFTQNEIINYDKKITKLLKSPELNLTKKQQKTYKKRPKKVKKTLVKQERSINNDLKILSSKVEYNAVLPLASLSKKIKRNENVSLTSLISSDVKSEAQFKTSSRRDQEQLIKLIKSMNIDGLEIKESDNKLEVSFKRIN